MTYPTPYRVPIIEELFFATRAQRLRLIADIPALPLVRLALKALATLDPARPAGAAARIEVVREILDTAADRLAEQVVNDRTVRDADGRVAFEVEPDAEPDTEPEDDPEREDADITALRVMVHELDGLDPAMRRITLRYLAERFGS